MKTFEYSISQDAIAKDGMATVSSICGFIVSATFRTLIDEGYGMCRLSRCSIEIDERPKCGEIVTIRVDSGFNNIVTILNRNVLITDNEGIEIGRAKIEWLMPKLSEAHDSYETPSRLTKRFINKFHEIMPDIDSIADLQLRLDLDFKETARKNNDCV